MCDLKPTLCVASHEFYVTSQKLIKTSQDCIQDITPTVYDITYTLLVTSQLCNYEKTPTMFLPRAAAGSSNAPDSPLQPLRRGSQRQGRGPAWIHRVLCTAGSTGFPGRSLLSRPSDGSWVRTQKHKATALTHLGRRAPAGSVKS